MEKSGTEQLETEIVQLKKQLREAHRLRDELLSNMSHEIRNPMAAILGYVELLDARLSDPTARKYLKIIKDSGDQLLSVMEDLVDLSKLESGQLEIKREPVALARLLNEVHALMNNRAREKGVQIMFRSEGDLPELVEADSQRLRQLIASLLGCAIGLTEQGAITLSARINESGDRLEFKVSGAGMKSDRDGVADVFQSSSQLGATGEKRAYANALRLALARRLAQAMGGVISSDTMPGNGSAFHVSLPVAILSTQKPTAAVPMPHGGRLDARVLAVDDREEFRFLLRHYLEAAGAEVVLAADGQAALDAFHGAQIEGRPFTVVILDLQMPVLDGFETARRLREEGARAPIIALTAAALSHDFQRSYGAGCDDHLAKPIDAEKLIETVARWCANRAAPETTASEPRSPGPAARQMLNILLIDDNRVTCKSLSMLLEMAGHQVRVAYDGRSALAVAKEFHADVVVSDINLPDLDGFRLLQALRDLGGMDKTKFIAVSGYAESEFDEREPKFDHFLHKPVKVEELESVISL